MGASAKQHQQQEEEDIFSKGSLVEVSTDEEGFKDAWFLATVIEPPPQSSSSSSASSSLRPGSKGRKTPYHRDPKVYVEYKTLYADENLSKPLRERVHVGFVRPVPPTNENPPAFEFDDVVDGYYRDGWWKGVITKVLQGSRFVVTFRSPPDEIEFALSDLRHHVDWVNGTWVRPAKKNLSGLMFSVGKKVEVLSEEEDAWFPATIVEDPGNGSFVVEYQTNPNEPQLCKVTVGSPRIRPCPPLLEDKNFILLEKVDAFYDFGWWSGVITKELADSRYVVFFKHTNKDREFNYSELRAQLRWKDGKWFTTSRDVIIPCHEKPEGLGCSDHNDTNMDVSHESLHISEGNSEGKKFEEKSPFSLKPRENRNEELSSGHEKSLITISPKKRTRHLPSDSGKMLLLPVEKLKKGVDDAVSSVIPFHQNTITSEKQSEGMVSGFDSPPTNRTGPNLQAVSMSGDQPFNNPSWGKKTRRKRQKIDGEENHTPSSNRKPGRPVTLLFRKPQSSPGSKEVSGVRNAAEVVEKECRAKEPDISAVIGLECIMMSGSRAGETRQLHGEECLKLEGDQKQQMNNPSVHKKELQAGESNQKKRRGRPPKVLVRSLETLVAEPNGNNAKEEVIVKDCITSEVDSLTTAGMVSMSVESSGPPTKEIVTYNGDGKNVNDNQPKQKTESGNSMKMSPARMPTEKKDQASVGRRRRLDLEKKDQASVRQHERHSPKRAKRRMARENQNSSLQDSSDATGRKTAESICIEKEVKMVEEEGPNKMLDDQPLSKWFEEMQSPSSVDGTRNSPARIVEQSTELSKRQKVVTQTPAIDDEGINVLSGEIVAQSPAVDKSPTVLGEPENLPFVKNTTLWAAVESMEVFQKMPQKPHFRPLQMYKESSREGLAIACMVTYSSAVEKISKLQFDDPREKIDDILDSLNDLESHGFDVQVLRDRIDKLLSIKVDHRKLDDQLVGIKRQIDKCNLDKAGKDEEIAGIEKQIQELQEKIKLAESVKEIKDGEIAALQSRLLNLEESTRIARSSFEGLAAGVL